MAVAADLQPIRERLAALLQIDDDAIFAQRAQDLAAQIDKLSKDILALPKCAQVLAETQIAALFTGLTQGQSARKSQLANGDVPGHDFHGNQWVQNATSNIKDVMSGKKEETVYGQVLPGTAAKIKAATGMDVSGHSHFIDKGALVHINRQHGVGHENQDDHLPITKDDIERIPQIVSNPDKVDNGGPSSRQKPTVKYTKKFPDGTTSYVEEEWSKEKLLATKTMYKKNAPGNSATPKGGVSHTS